jgi:DNA mismatch repair protein MutS
MKQYLSIKSQYPHAILLFRMGDFYETFFDDAVTASKELNIVLTARDKGINGQAVPLAGIPYHALDTYLAKLINKGHRVAICEQVEDPKQAKGLVKREVVRVITPGTIVEENLLPESANNYLAAISVDLGRIGLAAIDTSTGEFLATELAGEEAVADAVTELARLQPAEVIAAEGAVIPDELGSAVQDSGAALNPWNAVLFEEDLARDRLMRHFDVAGLEGFGCADKPALVSAAGAALAYVEEMQGGALSYISGLRVYSTSDYLVLDSVTLRDLEVFENIRDRGRKGTLFELLDLTCTSMGSRMLRRWLQHPLMDAGAIDGRILAVEELKEDLFARKDVRVILDSISDLERLVSRIVYGRASPRDLVAMLMSLRKAEELRTRFAPSSELLIEALEKVGDLGEVVDLIERGIVDEPPATVREGGIVRDGFDTELDELRSVVRDGGSWIVDYEARQKAETGIKNLKVRYNQVFGYYVEVSKANLAKVPETYVRKQTLVNSERFITEELKGMEDRILSARGRMESLEYDIFVKVREDVALRADDIQMMGSGVATIDSIAALAERAVLSQYVRPSVDEGGTIEINGGRHPVVEAHLGAPFVPNDTTMDRSDQRVLLITGPNMAGKSTYMRQVAHIVLMAQTGSFVPADSARIGIVDRIFTRVGAFDDLIHGQSTFMVEMLELANILNSATPKSLVLLDEIGRGTSTFDGMSIAWSVVEYIDDKKRIGAKTLFATHYHELTVLEERLEGVANYNVAISEEGHRITFLRKVVPGPSERSYGIHVAKLAGLPQEVIDRANEVLVNLEGQRTPDVPRKRRKVVQDVLFRESDVEARLKGLDVENMTPVEALNALSELKRKTRES